jgi:hypothetical protein
MPEKLNIYDREIDFEYDDYDDDYETLWLIWLIRIILKVLYLLIQVLLIKKFHNLYRRIH